MFPGRVLPRFLRSRFGALVLAAGALGGPTLAAAVLSEPLARESAEMVFRNDSVAAHASDGAMAFAASKYSASGDRPGVLLVSRRGADGAIWERTLVEPAFTTYEAGGIAFDSEGRILVAGRVNESAVFVVKYAADGERLWASQSAEPASVASRPLLFLDSRDQPVLVCTNGTTRFSRQGEHLGSLPFGPRRLTLATSRLDADDGLVLTGWGCAGPTPCSATDVRFGTFRIDGLGRWGDASPWNPADAPSAVSPRVLENSKGVTDWSVVGASVVISRRTHDGRRLWQTPVSVPGGPVKERMALGTDGAIFFATLPGVPNADPFLVRLDPDGRVAWQLTLGASAGQPEVKAFLPTLILPDAHGGAVLCTEKRLADNLGLADRFFSRVFRVSGGGIELGSETHGGRFDVSGIIGLDQEARLAFLRLRPTNKVEVRLAVLTPSALAARVGDAAWRFGLRSDLASPPLPLLRVGLDATLAAWVDAGGRSRSWTSGHPLYSMTDATTGSRRIPGGHAHLRLDFDSREVVAEWTAASGGAFRLSGTFYGGADGSPDALSEQKRPSLVVRLNGTTLTNASASTTDSWAFDLPLELRTGDIVELGARRPDNNHWPSITLDAAIARSDRPPTVAITQPMSGQTVPPGQGLEVTVGASDPDGGSVRTDLLVDGRVVQSRTEAPHRFDVAALPRGEHRIEARAYDAAGLAATSPVVLVYVDDAPAKTIFIPPADVHRTLFGATFSAALEEVAHTEYGRGLDLLVFVAARLHRQFPEAPPELLREFLREGITVVRGLPGAPGTGRGALHGSKRLAGAPEPKAYEGVRDVLVGGLCARFAPGAWDKCTYFGSAGLKAVDEGFGWLANYEMRSFDRKFREEGGEVIYEAAQKDPVIASGFDATLGAEIKTRISDSQQALLQRFDQVDKSNSGLAGQLRDVLTDTGAIRTDLKTFEAMAASQFSAINSGIFRQVALSRESLHLTSTIVGYLSRQDEAQSRKAAAEQKQAEYQQQLAGMQAGVSMLGTLIGFSDRQLGKKVTAVGTGAVKLFDAITKFSSGIGGAGGWASAALTGNVVGSVVGLVSSFFGGGPSPEELILKELGVIKEMIAELGKQMNQRFDRVDANLNLIYGEMLTQFAAIEFRLGVLKRDVDALQATATQIREILDRVELNQFTIAREQQRKDFNTAKVLLEAYHPLNGSLLTRAQFETFGAEFTTLATILAVNDISGPWQTAGRTDRDIAARLKDEWSANFNYLAALAADRGWLAQARFFRPGMVNPAEWALGARAFAELAEKWPEFARSVAARAWLERISDLGRNLESARRELALETVAGQSRPNRTLFATLVGNYRARAAALAPLLAAFDIEQRERLVAGDDLSRKSAARRLDLWGALDQDSGFEPEAFRSTNTLRWLPVELPSLSGFYGLLANPTGLYTRLKGEGLVPASTIELLGLGRFNAGYHHIAYDGVRRRDDCRVVAFTAGTGVFNQVYYSQVVKESRFRIDFSLLQEPSAPNGAFSTALTLRFFHPTYAFHSLDQALDYPAGYFVPDRVSNNQDTGSRDMNAYCELQDLWPNTTARVTTHWNGGREPDGKIRRTLASARQDFARLATTTQAIPGDLRRTWLAQIEARLRQFQRSHYDTLESRFEAAGNPLAEAGFALSGAREALRAFFRMAFPVTYEREDAIRAFFTGEEPLPDMAELRALCSRGRGITANSLDHRDHIDFPALIESRVAAFERLLNRHFDALQKDSEPEPLALVSDTLNRLDAVRELIARPAIPPALGLLDVSSTRLRVRLYGEPNAVYALQASPDLNAWSDTTNRVTDGTVRDIPVENQRGRFYRAVSRQ